MYTEIEQQTLDIDWFFTDGKYIGFIASGAGKLPESVATSSENNEKLVSYFRNLQEISEVIVNPKLNDLLIEIFGTGADERYLYDFVSMTKKGFYSFDKIYLNNFLDYDYHLVTSPMNPLTIDDLPQDILNIILQTKYSDGMKNVINIGKINSK
ncbi:hypothetical protein LF887_10900 [Chryseobacterium sp. MEBOG06]|uniref:hypothetical protein n=1 Tax=Chryseobacterium sp. MEBOG06 TaxID=2879938 RepID=UPI001F2992AB|nr:hypothetical protein [Chryseobacterium sp. MEBOG06]UKB86103.1 hypothetical protein LF887_10900 [Chryseobacterium sp. MEBOG06]